MKEYRDDAVFTVSLEGIKMSQEQIGRIDKGIKNVVMTELANIDYEGDLIINQRLNANPRFGGLNFPIIWGIWIEHIDIFKKRIIKTWK